MRPIALAVIVLSSLIAMPVVAFADDKAAARLQIKSELFTMQVKDQDGQPKTLRRLIVVLVNTGDQPITVVTEKLEKSKDVDEGGMTITLGLNATVKKDGHLIVPSLSSFAPVTIEPGEAAALSTDSIDLSEYKDGKLRIGYRVTDFWGKRLSLWAGSVTSETFIK